MDDLPLCECGCGKPVARKGNRFILGHNRSGKKHSPKSVAAIRKVKTGVPMSDAAKLHLSKVTKGKSKSLAHRAAMQKARSGTRIGKNNGNWKGGISFEPYCLKFTEELKQRIRKQYNNCDFISGIPDYVCNILNGKVWKLDIHHVDGNKMQGCDGVKWQLVPLSRRNHRKMHANEIFWERLICYALEYDETYYNIKQIDIYEMIKWKQTTEVISNMF